MGYFALWMAETGQGTGWATALGWNITPAGIGTMLGAVVFVAAPFSYVYGRPRPDIAQVATMTAMD